MTLYNCTKTFCIAFFDNLQDNLYQILSPDCRIQNKYGSARGINGISNCIKKLSDIHAILSELASSKTNMDINVISSTQTCILITNEGSEQSLIGIGLEWECNIITGIVCMQYLGTVDPDTFIELMYYNELEDDISNGNKYVQGIILSLDEVKEYNSNLTSIDGSYNTFSSNKSKEIKDKVPLDMSLILEGQDFFHIHTISKKEENQLLINKHLNILPPTPPEIVKKGILTKSKINRKNKRLGKKNVHFTTIANVILIEKIVHPKVSKRAPIPLSDIHYTSQDYRRFNWDREEELRLEMDLKNISRDDAELSLYQVEGLQTDHNIIITSNELETRGDGERRPTEEGESDVASFDRVSMSRRSSISRESLGRDSTGPSDFSIVTRERSKSMDDDVDRDLILKKRLENEVKLAEAQKLKENAKNTWYPGKYVSILRGGGGEIPKNLEDKARESITFTSSTQKNNANRNTKDIKYTHKKYTKNSGYILRRILIPPKRVRPVIIHITVVCCNNLLTPIWPMSIDSYVEMNVDGEKQFTEISYGHKNPIYDSSEIYTFVLSLENTFDNYIYFTVWDKRNVGQDTALGITRCSFAALKCQKDNRQPVSVMLPLLDSVHEDILGNGFCNSGNYHQHITTKSSRKELTYKEKNKSKPTISLLLSKVDIDSYEILNKLKIEDDEREKIEVNNSWV
jgi:hypothetical protein